MAEKTRKFDPRAFRAELQKIMPGYDWTVHRALNERSLSATGTQSSGFNRLSTLQVTRTNKNGAVWYEAMSSGHGTRAPWLGANGDRTLARALRGLQELYEHKAAKSRAAAASLQIGRQAGKAGRLLDGVEHNGMPGST